MAIKTGVNILKRINRYSENVLPITSLFSSATTVNKTAGSTFSTAQTQTAYKFKQGRGIQSYNDSTSTALLYNFGSALTTTVDKTGLYVLSLEILHLETTIFENKITVHVLINSVDTYQIECNLVQGNVGIQKDNFHTFAQSFALSQNDVVDFIFEHTVDPSSITGDSTIYFDALKLEIDDRNITGEPTTYSFPKDYSSADGKETLGIYDYANTLTAQSFTGTPIKLLNDGLGANTNKTYALKGIADIFDTVTNQLDFSSLTLGDKFEIRLQLEITTTSVNQEVNMYINVAIGSGADYVVHLGREFFKTVGTYEINYLYNFIYIGNAETRDYPAEIIFNSDANATVLVGGFATIVNKRLL